MSIVYLSLVIARTYDTSNGVQKTSKHVKCEYDLLRDEVEEESSRTQGRSEHAECTAGRAEPDGERYAAYGLLPSEVDRDGEDNDRKEEL